MCLKFKLFTIINKVKYRIINKDKKQTNKKLSNKTHLVNK